MKGEKDKLKRGEMPVAKNRPSNDEKLSDNNNWEEQSELLEAPRVEKSSIKTEPELPPAEKISTR